MRTHTGRRLRKEVKLLPGHLMTYVFLALLLAVIFSPAIWGISTSFKPQNEIFEEIPHWIPKTVVLRNYLSVFRNTSLPRHFLNSIIIAGLTVIATIVVSSPAAYKFARSRQRSMKVALFLFLGTMMIPGLISLIPLYVIMSHLNILNTYWVLVIMYTGWNVPFSIWILKSFIETIPRGLEESALIDGCNEFQVFYKIVLPNSVPGLVAGSTIVFINSWNEFIAAVTFTSSDASRTVPVGLQMLQGYYLIRWGPIMAAAILSIIPTLVLFFLLQQHLVAGLSKGAIKG